MESDNIRPSLTQQNLSDRSGPNSIALTKYFCCDHSGNILASDMPHIIFGQSRAPMAFSRLHSPFFFGIAHIIGPASFKDMARVETCGRVAGMASVSVRPAPANQIESDSICRSGLAKSRESSVAGTDHIPRPNKAFVGTVISDGLNKPLEST